MNRRQALVSAAALGFATAAAPLPALARHHGPDIVDIAAGNPDFATLVAAVQAAGLVDTLKGRGPFTVFAPTNAAFAALPAGTVESLLEPASRDTLVDILTYHVVLGRVPAEMLLGNRGRIGMVNGGEVTFDATRGTVRLNRSATVVSADIAASNGVIHVIDSVLLPG